MTTEAVPAAGYRKLLAQPGFARLTAASLLARLGGTMWSVTIVLFVLDGFHSPSLAGLTVLLSLAPGLLVSPLAGAALDRYHRVYLIASDYAVGAATIVVLVGLAAGGRLSVALLLVVVAVSSITVPLGMAGARSMFPILAPQAMWDRANALDSIIYSLARVSGPALAGLLVGFFGGRTALLTVAVIWGVATVFIIGIRDPTQRVPERNVAHEAWEGLHQLWRNPVLRGISMAVPVQNIGLGCLLLALPVLTLRNLHGGPPVVGWLLSAQAVASLISGVLAGRLVTLGRERRLMTLATTAIGLSVVALAFAPTIPAALVLMFVSGLPAGFLDVPLFSLRQRSVGADLLGRVMAVSISLNFLGQPLGAGLAGPLAGYSPRLALAVAGVIVIGAALIFWVSLPAPAGRLARPVVSG